MHRTILILALLAATPSAAAACGDETKQVPRSAVSVEQGQGTELLPPPPPPLPLPSGVQEE